MAVSCLGALPAALRAAAAALPGSAALPTGLNKLFSSYCYFLFGPERSPGCPPCCPGGFFLLVGDVCSLFVVLLVQSHRRPPPPPPPGSTSSEVSELGVRDAETGAPLPSPGEPMLGWFWCR